MSFSEYAFRDHDAAKTLGMRISNRALELRLKHAEVAKRAGIEYKTYMNYRTGARTPDPTTLSKIATALETTMEALTTDETAWYSDDPKTSKALQDIRRAADDLSSEDLAMLADFALVAKSRRKEENWNPNYRNPAFEIQARIHERLLPVIIRQYGPTEVLTVRAPNIQRGAWLRVDLGFKPHTDLEGAKNSVLQLVKNRLQISDERNLKTEIVSGNPNGEYPQGPKLRLYFRLNADAAPLK